MCKGVHELKQYHGFYHTKSACAIRIMSHLRSDRRSIQLHLIGKNAFKVQYEQALQEKEDFKPAENRMQRPYDTYGSDAAMARVG